MALVALQSLEPHLLNQWRQWGCGVGLVPLHNEKTCPLPHSGDGRDLEWFWWHFGIGNSISLKAQ